MKSLIKIRCVPMYDMLRDCNTGSNFTTQSWISSSDTFSYDNKQLNIIRRPQTNLESLKG